ncbi:MAG TPA: efflux RND transporter periplasmic adaptor subunit [Gemmatimonadales bacterium]|jgi:membrane fusion protein (multidrug efflux system)|nr:efflux RND transporter periplasmic adaptor subunit [Gemmatimonadales bacterium]
MSRAILNSRGWIASTLLFATILATGAGLAAWKYTGLAASAAASANQPEPMEVITAAVATEREHRRTTTSIGTVLALRSITLRNEVAGTVSRVQLTPGQIVDAGTVLVAIDASVEEAELEAQRAQAGLAKTTLDRLESLRKHNATSQEEVDQARAQYEVAIAQMARTRALIAKKVIRAPFRARVGIADVHPGQYLNEGTTLTTLQGVADAAHVDFTVAQRVAAGLQVGDSVLVYASGDPRPLSARIVAVDARVDPNTRNATVRARLSGPSAPAPGASVRVQVPVGALDTVIGVPVSALRKGPQGDHVFVIAADSAGKPRAHVRTVQSGPVLGEDVLIYDGIEAGEQVATSGSFKLREAVLVAIADTNPQAAAPEGVK